MPIHDLLRQPWRALLLAFFLALLFAPNRAAAQVELRDVKLHGKIESLDNDEMVIVDHRGDKTSVTVSDFKLRKLFVDLHIAEPKKLRLTVSGDAEFEYLSTGGRDGMYVTIPVELLGGKSMADVKTVTIFTPNDDRKPEFASTSPGGDGQNGSYLVSGRLRAIHDRSITVSAPNSKGRLKSVNAKLAPDAKIAILSDDASLIHPGDTVEIKGYTLLRNKKPIPGIWAETVNVKLAETLTGKKKAHHKTPEKTDSTQTAEAKKDDPTPAKSGGFFDEPEPAAKPAPVKPDGAKSDAAKPAVAQPNEAKPAAGEKPKEAAKPKPRPRKPAKPKEAPPKEEAPVVTLKVNDAFTVDP